MICPNCGHSEESGQPIERDGFFIDPFGAVKWNDTVIPLRGPKRELLYVLASSSRKFTPDALLIRMGSIETESNVLASQICNLRHILRAAGAPNPIITDAPGYRWQTPG